MIEQLSRLSPDDLQDITEIVSAAEAADGVAPLSEHTLLHLREGNHGPESHFVARRDGRPVGYAHLDVDTVEGDSTELVIAPDARRQGLGRRLLQSVIQASEHRPLRIWAHGRLPGAAALAASTGFTRDRALHRMTRPLGADSQPLAEPRWAEGISVRPFRPGHDEAPWLRVNSRAFTELPDQGGWSLADLQQREAEAWFDPAGFFLAERDGELLGFHWTKVHGSSQPHGHQPIGEVYVVGVDPAAQGLGLGRALTLLGLHHLQDAGLAEVMLYVDDANAPALQLYQSLGFVTRDLDVRFAYDPAHGK